VLSSVFALDGVVAFVADKDEAAMGMCPAPIDFELLRVVGQGAFGKVERVASPVAHTPSRNWGSSELHATCNDTSALSSLSSSPLPSPFVLRRTPTCVFTKWGLQGILLTAEARHTLREVSTARFALPLRRCFGRMGGNRCFK